MCKVSYLIFFFYSFNSVMFFFCFLGVVRFFFFGGGGCFFSCFLGGMRVVGIGLLVLVDLEEGEE